MRLETKLAMNLRRLPCEGLIVAAAGTKRKAPCFEAHGRSVQRAQRPLFLYLLPVALPDLTVCLQHPSRVQSWLIRSDHLTRADDRLLKATAVEQRFIQIKEQARTGFISSIL